MKLLDQYFDIQEKIYNNFGYKEYWREIPLADFTEYYWAFSKTEYGDEIKYASEVGNVFNGTGIDGFSCSVYMHPRLSKWIYTSNEHTMMCIDTHSDNNKYLAIFDNSKVVSEDSEGEK